MQDREHTVLLFGTHWNSRDQREKVQFKERAFLTDYSGGGGGGGEGEDKELDNIKGIEYRRVKDKGKLGTG